MKSFPTAVIEIVAFASIALARAAAAAEVDLGTWTAESYPAVTGFNAGQWNVSGDGTSVTQTVNGQPTLFYSDFDANGTEVRGTLTVSPNTDDDIVGFALGFSPGDTSNSDADYLLVDWKQATQPFNFGAPSTTPGSTSFVGLAVSHVYGVPTADEFWGHVDFPEHPGGSVQELARATTLGASGFVFNTTYDFRFVYVPTRLKVYVNDTLELDIEGSFPDGRFAFYNFSQAAVTYGAFELDEVSQCGDHNGNGKVTSTDALGVLRVAVGGGSCLDCVCDTDDSGLITSSDALRVLRYSVGQSVTLNCPSCT